ncbi:MAG: restriction endonuclease subunit S [Ignavibacteria bacterium]|nr:restriction endonuclease subunit S [Ignavibacteria bacterium]
MKSNYKRIGDHIKLVDERNKGLRVQKLLGLSISKQFIPSVANIIGTDMENYKLLKKPICLWSCTMQVRRDNKMPVALLKDVDEAIISQAYPIFEVKNEKELLPEYLMMWFERPEFDREVCFHAVGGVRGSLEWEDFEDMQLPVPPISKQREIVKEYNTIQKRIELNQQMIEKLEETAQAIYKQWFVEGIDLENLPEGWRVGKVEDSRMKSSH